VRDVPFWEDVKAEEWKGLLERHEFTGEVEEACWDDGKRA
jgi:hypothetical protein